LPLTSGSHLGPYEILEPIGRGGMGEVYRATDTNLKRQVAIKVLPEPLARDAERLARFQREAEVLASLNHPNIAQIYGLAESRSGGSSDPPVRALVMELVEGSTLADRIALGPMPVAEALAIARQIAEALETAHEIGVVHRDLKPANVKVRPDGTVKVLDFGLAKAMDPAGSMSPGETFATITSPAMTQAGVILGTAAYMSPEQARGKPADKRSDVWALGAVLFEMLTGKRAYEGEEVSDTLAAVLRGEPDWSALPPATPPQLRRVIQRCLQRDPRQRTRDIGDVRLDLEEIAAAPMRGSGETVDSREPRRLTLVPWALAVLGLASSAVLVTLLVRDSPVTPRVARLELAMPQGVELYRATYAVLGLSPEGSRMAFIGIVGGLRSVYLRQLDSFEAVPIRGTETASWCCSFAPDGSALLFTAADGTLKSVSVADHLVTAVATDTDFAGADWGPGNTVLFARSGQLWQVSASGGHESQVTKDESGGVVNRWPTMLPGGVAALVATGNATDGTESSWRIDAIVLATGERQTVMERGTFPHYTSTGHVVFYRDGELLAAPFDVGTRRTTGTTVRAFEDLPRSAQEIPILAMSASGVLVYSPTTSVSQLVWVSRQGVEHVVADTPRSYANPRLGPGGRWVLVQAGELWVHDVARSTFRLLSNPNFSNAYPVLSPDGATVVFRGTRDLRRQLTDGSGRDQAIAGTALTDYPATISPDGEQLLFVRLSPKASGDIYTVSLRGDGDPKPVLVTDSYEGSAKLSPNGRWLAYSSNDSGKMEVYLRPFPSPDKRWQVSTQGGTQPIWNSNGREIFYRSDNKMIAVSLSLQGDEPTLSPPVVLFDQAYEYGSGITIPNYDVSADGQQFLMVKGRAGASQLRIVLNWFEELKRLAASR
jgi:serine/threonine protein kinase/Tol biopolymer transport system component